MDAFYFQSGCDINMRDGGGWTALWHAVSDSNESHTRALVQGGGDIGITDSDGRSLVQEAMVNEADEIVEILSTVRR